MKICRSGADSSRTLAMQLPIIRHYVNFEFAASCPPIRFSPQQHLVYIAHGDRRLRAPDDQWPNAHDMSSLRLLGSVGEPINPAAWEWYYKVIGKDRCPIVDTWWQTETGAILI